MAEDLTPDQQALLDENRLSARPTYYDAATSSEQSVGKDFEAFAILLDDALREETIDRLGVSQETDAVRDELYAECVHGENEEGQLHLVDYTKVLNNFAVYRFEVQATPYGNTPDVSALLQDVQRPIEQEVSEHDHWYHVRQMASLLSELRASANGGDSGAKQLASWQGPLSAYRRVS